MAAGQQFTKTQYGGETTYGTEASSYTELARVQNIDLQSANGYIRGRGLGDGVNALQTYYGQFQATGSITYQPLDFDFLKHWIGPATAGSPNLITEADNVSVSNSSGIQAFSIEKLNDGDSTDDVEYALGCVGTDFTISARMNEIMSINASFVAQKTGHRITHETYSSPSGSAYIMVGGTWKWGSTPSAFTGLRSFEISYSNGLITDTYSMESRFMNKPVMGQRTYNFRLEVIMSSDVASTFISDFYQDDSSPYLPNDGSSSSSPATDLEFEATVANGSSTGVIKLDECSIDRISKPAQVGGGLVVLTVEGTAHKGKSNQPLTWT